MVLPGLTTRKVSKTLYVSQSAVGKWMKNNRQGRSLKKNKPKSGRPKRLDKVSKLPIGCLAKSSTPIHEKTGK